MVHGDNSGLVIPPRVAEFQVVIVTIPKGKMEDSAREAMSGKARELASTLQAAGIRVHFDDRDNYTPGFKYNYWELRGACIRMEIGPKDMENGNVVLVRRDDRSKTVASWNGLAESVHATLEKMQSDLFERAKKERDDHLKMESSWQGFMTALNARNIVMCPWCEKVRSGHRLRHTAPAPQSCWLGHLSRSDSTMAPHPTDCVTYGADSHESAAVAQAHIPHPLHAARRGVHRTLADAGTRWSARRP